MRLTSDHATSARPFAQEIKSALEKTSDVKGYRVKEACVHRQIFVKTLTGKTLTLYAKPSDSIDTVKAMLQVREGIAPEMQRLIFGGKPLQKSERTLAEYSVQDGATMHLLVEKLH